MDEVEKIEYPRIAKVHHAEDHSDGSYIAWIDIEWGDGNIETCPYCFIPASNDPAPLHVALVEMLEGDLIKLTEPPVPVVSNEAPDVIA